MADRALLAILDRGVDEWNKWAGEHADARPDLGRADLRGRPLAGIDLSGAELQHADLAGADLSGADLHDSDLSGASFRAARLAGADLSRSFGPVVDFSAADLRRAELGESKFPGARFAEGNLLRARVEACLLPHADFSGARLKGASFVRSDLSGARFARAKLHGAVLSSANLTGASFAYAVMRVACLSRANLANADLTGADLRRALLEQTVLVETDLSGATLTGCSVYGVSAWELRGTPAAQHGLIVSPRERSDGSTITVDDLDVAQFIYLLIDHKKLRRVIDSVTRRGVLILGRFQNGGLEMLQVIAAGLRALGYLPIIFNFDRPENRDYTETVQTLVGLSRFVVVDLSGPSVPQELMATVPFFEIPFVPVIEKGRRFPSMLADLLRRDWMLKPVIEFADARELAALLQSRVVAPAEAKLADREKLMSQIFARPGGEPAADPGAPAAPTSAEGSA